MKTWHTTYRLRMKTEISLLIEKHVLYIMFPSFEEVVCSLDCVTRELQLTQISKSYHQATCSPRKQVTAAFWVNACASWQIPHPETQGAPLRDGRCQSLSRAGHKLLSLQWRISLPRPLIYIWELNAFPPTTTTTTTTHIWQPLGFYSQYYKVSFVYFGSVVRWDSSTLAHMRILGVRGLLRLNMASRHRLSFAGWAGATFLCDLWARHRDKGAYRQNAPLKETVYSWMKGRGQLGGGVLSKAKKSSTRGQGVYGTACRWCVWAVRPSSWPGQFTSLSPHTLTL